MKLIAGLGNPGNEYHNTRHNIGWAVIDLLSEKYSIPLDRKKRKSLFGKGRTLNGDEIVLLKPLTYMNLSGRSIRHLSSWFKIQHRDIILVFDDINLPLGKLRIRRGGSAGGHNGVQSVLNELCDDTFPRIRIGIGPPAGSTGHLIKHVLGTFSDEEKPIIQSAVDRAAHAVDMLLHDDIQKVMNEFN